MACHPWQAIGPSPVAGVACRSASSRAAAAVWAAPTPGRVRVRMKGALALPSSPYSVPRVSCVVSCREPPASASCRMPPGSCLVSRVACLLPLASLAWCYRRRSMRRSSVAAVVLALLLPTSVAGATSAATNYCSLLLEKSLVNDTQGVWMRTREVSVTLAWHGEPARAAATLLHALLRHALRYARVSLPREPVPRGVAGLQRFHNNMFGAYDDLVIAVSAAWEPNGPPTWNATLGPQPGLAGPRLAEFGASAVPARRRLFAWLRPLARARPASCARHVRWAFYADPTARALCDFGAGDVAGNVSAVEVLVVGDCNSTLQRLQARADATETPLHVQHVTRSDFVRTLQTANRSFLFLDYDMWKGVPTVSAVEPPPCVTVDFDCKQELDSAIGMRIADVDILKTYAPQLFQFVHDFKPSLESLRLILERHASGVDIEEAGCEEALKYKIGMKYIALNYIVPVYFCSDDPSNNLYENITRKIFGKIINDQLNRWFIHFRTYLINCSDIYNMSKTLDAYTRTAGTYMLVGMVSMAVEGAAAASASAAAGHVPLMLADVVPEGGTDAATWRVAGRPRHIARALRHFVRASGWSRVAVLSQPTSLAQDYYRELKHKSEIIFRDFPIGTNLTAQQAQAVLQDLQAVNARIVFVNADSQAADTILTAAAAAGMGYADGIVWIVREWRQDNVTCATKHFTVSFWDRGLEDIPAAEGSELRKKLSELKSTVEHPWPPRAVSLANALLTLSIGFKDVFERFPSTRRDLRTPQMIPLLQDSIMNTPVTGVGQRLRYKQRSLEEAFVFVDQWCGSSFSARLATWRVNATSGSVRGAYSRPAQLPRADGASRCVVRSGEPFAPRCHDAECACALLLLALAPGAALLARRALRRHVARLQQQQQLQLLARRRHVAAVLAAHLVPRQALTLHEEIGAGRFGSVCLARLREPGRAPRYVAAKALRDNAAPAEESEFLREACTIASLDHAHVVRLVGVCIADGPPLVLMELAFFGDLLGYLRARRHLVDGAGTEPGEAEPGEAEPGEAEHVSGAALTRLAREAAEALAYLGARGVVHRDVRAANCLLDVRRALKLADFGMARHAQAGAGGAAEYSCRRRGLFPVLWMAPESLAHGVFSAASDVWALGVLLLELVTLGARPYGAMSPLRVLEFVAAGGCPPLPLDATPQTRGLAQLCWARAAERRPSAAEVARYLAAWPLALRPALLSERDAAPDADSGFGGSPSIELLPPDSPFHSLDQLDDLAATH